MIIKEPYIITHSNKYIQNIFNFSANILNRINDDCSKTNKELPEDLNILYKVLTTIRSSESISFLDCIEYLESVLKKYRDIIVPGKFIVIEGTDGIGKSTAMEAILDMFPHANLTREPGGTNVSEKIRGIILDTNNKSMTDLTELLLYYASRAQHIEERIIPYRQIGVDIISSRYFDSSMAYQALNEYNLKSIPKLNEVILSIDKLAIPTAVVSLYTDDSDAIYDRMCSNRTLDRLEQKGREFLRKTNEYYKNIKPVDGYDYKIIKICVDGLSIEDMQNKIKEELKCLIN